MYIRAVLLSAATFLLMNHAIGAAIAEPRDALIARTAKDARQYDPNIQRRFFTDFESFHSF